MSETIPDPSRQRILLVAMQIFAENGYQSSTVREICQRAEVNIASVNYYFRNKEGLYAEALAFAFLQAEHRYPMTIARDRQLPAQRRLEEFISVFLHRILDDSELGFHGQLIAREIAHPTNALDGIVKSIIFPMFDLLSDIVPQLTQARLTKAQTHRCILSIVGQCLMYKHSRPIIDRICPELIANTEEIELTSQHIAQFSLLALNHYPAGAES